MCVDGGCVKNIECKTDDDCKAHTSYKMLEMEKKFLCAMDIKNKQHRCFQSCSGNAECGVHQICLQQGDNKVRNFIVAKYSVVRNR